MKHFFHGHSFAGNPIACAAALANLDLFEVERTLERAALIIDALRPALEQLAANPAVRDVRYFGLMIGVEIDGEQIGKRDALSPAWRIADELYRRGHFTRPIGDVIQLVPPLSSTVEEVKRFTGDLHDVLA
jgi:adenosylmethionine-8-amino-7-oxononanoate aminotransferase